MTLRPPRGTRSVRRRWLARPHLPGWLAAADALLIVVVVVAAIAIGRFVQDTLKQLRRGLPARVLVEQSDISRLQHDLSELVHAAQLALLDASPQHRAALGAALHTVEVQLDRVRRVYASHSLVGAADAHAALHPALQDIDDWLRKGVGDNQPSSPFVLRLVEARAEQARHRARELFANANARALALVNDESERLQSFRHSLVAYLGAFALFAIGVIALLVRQQHAEARLARARKRLTDSIEAIGEGFALYDSHDRLLVCNSRYRDLYPDAAPATRPGASFAQLVHHLAERDAIVAVGEESVGIAEAWLERHQHPHRPFELRLQDGRFVQVKEYRTREGGHVAIHTDVTENKRIQDRLEHLASHDVLSGLPNRALFEDRLTHAMAQARRHDRQVALVLFDLDRFKLVNDTLGHAAGDMVLRSVAATLKRCLRSADTAARLGGDEFGAIIEDVVSWKDVGASVERVLGALAADRDIGGCEIFPTASAGIALYPNDGATLSELMRSADAACYHAKSLGRNRYHFYTAELTADAGRRVAIETRLRHALANREFTLHYQPVMEVATRCTTAIEALLRWRNPEFGLVEPEVFTPIAEEMGLTSALGEWVLREACTQGLRWREQGLGAVPIWVNLSSRRWLASTELAEVVKRVLAETRTPPTHLGLDIKESALIDDTQRTLESLQRLGAIGIRLAIDDFGRGYSPLANLKRCPLYALKIDASLVRGITANEDDAAIAGALIAMAHSLHLRVIAEGVETEEQLTLLAARGCDEFQGYLAAPPLPPAEAEAFLARAAVLPLAADG